MPEHDALVVLGGSMDADDDRHPWLEPTRALIRTAADRGVPTLGICLGHQLCALAFGGEVGRSPLGQQVGLYEIGWTDAAADDALLGGLASGGRGVQWNDDLVLELPDDAVALARTPRDELQAARFAPTVWGVQWHPEVDVEILRVWAEEDAERHLRTRDRPGRGARRHRPCRARARSHLATAGRRPGAAGRGVAADTRMNRPVTTKGNLLRLGFQDAEAALDSLRQLGGGTEPLVAILSRTADPDAALSALVRLVEAADDAEELLAAVCDDEGTSMRLLSVLGASTALADHLVRHPEHWRELRDPTLGSTRPAAYAIREGLLEAVGADPSSADPGGDAAGRGGRRRAAGRVPPGAAPPGRARPRSRPRPSTTRRPSCPISPAATLDAALAIARQRVGESASLVRLAVVAMGKCGGHELNYVSDVDVIFVHEPADGADAPTMSRARRCAPPPSSPAT